MCDVTNIQVATSNWMVRDLACQRCGRRRSVTFPPSYVGFTALSTGRSCSSSPTLSSSTPPRLHATCSLLGFSETAMLSDGSPTLSHRPGNATPSPAVLVCSSSMSHAGLGKVREPSSCCLFCCLGWRKIWSWLFTASLFYVLCYARRMDGIFLVCDVEVG